ncbi:hypothetical protein [Achromobacter ruhlandii]|uniref:hypothetical protein n=1 Tax=Achromobacter ruhlandii TaxID=72557 RepID=UPI001E48B59E|nr:hypothetical protein [Achromobacter ruhlandii]
MTNKTDTHESRANAAKRPAGETAKSTAEPGGQANAPRSDTAAAHQSGKFGADEPQRERAAEPRRGADDRPHPKGAEYEEGGQYPGTRKPAAGR